MLLRRQREEYGKFFKAAGLLTQNERTQVYGYDRSKSAKTVWAERKSEYYRKGQSQKGSDIFNIGINPKGDSITPRSLYNALNKNEIGKETLQLIRDLDINVVISYDEPFEDGILGYVDSCNEYDKTVVIFASICKSVKKTAAVTVHEVEHIRINKPNTKNQELQCYIKEHKFEFGDLTEDQKNDIIKHIDDNYPKLVWK